MANRLKMAEVQSILLLHSQGWSRRRVARELCVDRETVSRYVQLDQQSSDAVELDGGISKPANAPISGPGSPAPVEPPIAPIEPTGPVAAIVGGRTVVVNPHELERSIPSLAQAVGVPAEGNRSHV